MRTCVECFYFEDNDNGIGTCELWVINVEIGSEECEGFIPSQDEGDEIIASTEDTPK